MCVKTIVDANAFRHLGEEARNSAGHQIRGWITRGDGLIVYSSGNNQYACELKRNNDVQDLLRDYHQRGLAIDVGDEAMGAALEGIPGPPTRRSDDPHMLALAGATGATVLFSCDDRLCQDFANTTVLGNVGRQRRRSVPSVFIHSPADIGGASVRRNFFARRRCRAR